MDIQKLFDAISESNRSVRSGYHVTLGAAIETLKGVAPDVEVVTEDGSGVGRPRSYRGYYSDLSLEEVQASTAGGLLKELQAALGNTFEGYKGGDFTMAEDTPLWLAPYGCTGPAIVGMDKQDGKIIIRCRDVD